MVKKTSRPGHLATQIAFMALLLASPACQPADEAASTGAESATGSETIDERLPVKTELPTRGEISSFIQTSTTIKTKREVDVYSKAIGICRDVHREEGDLVGQGDLLAELSDEELTILRNQARARAEKAAEDFKRAEQMFADDLISSKAFEEARFLLNLAGEDLALSEKKLMDTSIRAPLDGVISERHVKVGDLVTTTKKLFQIVDMGSLQAVVHVPERDYNRVRAGQPAEISVDSIPNRTFSGSVARINPVIDPDSGTMKVTVDIGEESPLLKPGLFIRVRIVTDTHEDALLVPKEAVVLEKASSKIFVVSGGSAQERVIETGYENYLWVEVVGGLKEGEDVVVLGHLGIKDNTPVRIIK
ncbi:efflux RND transporter periplasmic adaptor subunit [Thermodesulfobacteriota bacterium]